MTSPQVSTYWWNARSNFGDQLGPMLLRHFARVDPVWADPLLTESVSVGSVLDLLPPAWDGIVLGSGQLHAHTSSDLTNALVLGLRGHLTAERVRTHPHSWTVIGDPGLLASELVPAQRGKYQLGVVPHWTDTELWERERINAKRYKYADTTLIDSTQDPKTVIEMIGSCDKIVSSSLHGIVVADSFGIPRRVEPFPRMNAKSEGGAFKFMDYASAIGQQIEFGHLQSPPREQIETIRAELFDMFREFGRMIACAA